MKMICKICKKKFNPPGQSSYIPWRENKCCPDCWEKTEETPFGRVIPIKYLK
jgi:hypothetical protein